MAMHALPELTALLVVLAAASAPAAAPLAAQQRRTARQLGVTVGVLPPGGLNAITDVAGVADGAQARAQEAGRQRGDESALVAGLQDAGREERREGLALRGRRGRRARGVEQGDEAGEALRESRENYENILFGR